MERQQSILKNQSKSWTKLHFNRAVCLLGKQETQMWNLRPKRPLPVPAI